MHTLKSLGFIGFVALSQSTLAADFEFDHPGLGFSTSITPVGQVAWEQSLPNAQYEEKTVAGQKVKSVQVRGDLLLRTGLAKDTELQLGWGGPAWSKVSVAGHGFEDSGLGDVSIALKHAIDLDDDKLRLAVLAQAVIATGNDNFSAQEDIYSLSSKISYQYEPQIQTGLTMRYAIQDGELSVSAIPVINYGITDKLSGFSELYYTKVESLDHQYGVVSGLIYELTPRSQIDASIGVDLDGAARNYKTGLGFSFLF